MGDTERVAWSMLKIKAVRKDTCSQNHGVIFDKLALT